MGEDCSRVSPTESNDPGHQLQGTLTAGRFPTARVKIRYEMAVPDPVQAPRILRREPLVPPERLPGELHPVLRRVYAARAVADPAELDRSLPALLPPDQLGGLEAAVARLAAAVQAGERILIVGDFDADGATSCALAVLALRAMGCRHVDYLVPNRFEFGYGLTPEIVALARTRLPDLIVTVDNGVSSVAGVAAANAAGIPVIVTDHHLPGAELPAALAIVNPNLPDNPFPSKAAAGVGVIFYVLAALRSRLRELDWFARAGIAEPNLAEFLDLVALGTVADVVPLDANNRILVHQGLARIRAGRCRPGITALLQAAGRSPQRVLASDMGFAVGPRLNAAGRLDDMSLGIECLLTDDLDTAARIAAELDRLNRERRGIEEAMQDQALAMLDELHLAAEGELPWGLCLCDERWHQGVIGILASRIRERYHRPVIAFAPGGEGELKGSARSIPGLHIRDALDEVAARHPGLLTKFGGHAMAAGMTLAADRFADFRAAFDAVVRTRLAADDLQAVLHSDGELAPEELSLELAEALADGGPWGQAFPEPLFDGLFETLTQRIVGERHWKLVLRPEGSDLAVDAIAFNQVQHFPDARPPRLRAAYRLDANEFRGNVTLQLRIEYMEPA
ncbi:MAG: single-stranded-DNA-specific exonuclease [Pseudomonadota bacterium]